MTLTGSENHDIPLATAAQWTLNFRNASAADATIAHCFGKDAIQAIFNQTGCVGMRIYYAIDGNGAKQLVVVGVDSNGNDLYEGYLAERSYKCPSTCSASNPLNSNS
jgi:hypothetical protein